MAILAYVGLPGHGKTYSVIAHIVIPALQDKRRVVINIPLNMDEIECDFPDADIVHYTSKDELLAMNEDVLNGAIIICDESHKFWPAGTQVKQFSPREQEFFAEHRHAVDIHGNSQQLILITQDLGNLAACFRKLIEQTYLARKLIAVNRNQFKMYIHGGNITGTDIVKSKLLGEDTGIKYTYDKSVYKYYKSATKSKTGTVGNEETLDKRLKLGFIATLAKMAVIVFVGILCLGFYAAFFAGDDEEPEKPAQVSAPPAAQSTPAPAPARAQFKPAPVSVSPPVSRPYQNLKISLTGWMDNGKIINGVKQEQFVMFFVLHDGTNRVMELSSSQLMMAGYQVRWRNDCLAELSYDNWKEWAICDAPKVAVPDSPKPDKPLSEKPSAPIKLASL